MFSLYSPCDSSDAGDDESDHCTETDSDQIQRHNLHVSKDTKHEKHSQETAAKESINASKMQKKTD